MLVRIAFALIVAATFAVTQAAHGGVLAYDGFAAGGTAPGTGQYVSQPDSTTGTNNDALIGQGPALAGFTGSWTGTASDYRSYVYYRINDTGLTYGSLQTSPGDVELFRTTGSSSLAKAMTRGLNFTGGNSVYFSLLLSFDAVREITVKFFPGSNSISLGTNSSGKAVIGYAGTNKGTSVGTLAVNTTHLLIARVNDDDTFTLWVDPTDLTNELANTPAATGSGISYGTGNLFNQIQLSTSAPTTGSSTILDEIRVGDTWANALPIPEPASLSLLALGSIALLRRRA